MLVLDRAVYDDVLDHAHAAVPREACGVLAGTREPVTGNGENEREPARGDENGDERVRAHATTAYRTENAAAAPRVRYEIDPTELLSVVETIEEAGRDVVGFYHSHPAGPASPSDTDRREATWPDHHYVVVSLTGRPATFGAWVWTGEAFVRDAVRVADSSGRA